MPDATLTLEEVIAAEDRFALRVNLEATHTGEVPGIAPTGKPVSITGIYLAHLENGKIVEAWLLYTAPPWVQLLNAQGEAAEATPAVAGTLDDLLTVPGVVASIEFAADGALVAYRSEIDVPRAEVEQTAEFIASANTFLPALLARYNELSTLEWDAPRWLVFSSNAWTAVVSGNRAVLAETAVLDFNQLYGALVGAR